MSVNTNVTVPDGCTLTDESSAVGTCGTSRHPALVGVLVLPPGAGLVRRRFRCSVEQEVEVRRDEGVGRRDRIGVVDGAVFAREGDPAWILSQPVGEIGADLA